jgi:hypothetical protein
MAGMPPTELGRLRQVVAEAAVNRRQSASIGVAVAFMRSLRRDPISMHCFDGRFPILSAVEFRFGGCMDAVFIGLSVALVALLVGLVKVCDVLGDRT